MFIQLYRTTDEATSEPIEFRYKFLCDNTDGNRKRPRYSQSNYPSDVPENRSQSNDLEQTNDLEGAPEWKEEFNDGGKFFN